MAAAWRQQAAAARIGCLPDDWELPPTMKQVFQNLSDGTTNVVDVPAPQLSAGHVLIRTQASLVSPGTERMLVDFGRASLLDKARQQPERVREVLDKVQTDGLGPTVQAVRSKLSSPIPLGYASAGIILAVGQGVEDFSPGDFVASNGPHAEVVSVPRNLVVKVPRANDRAAMSPAEAAFAPVGAIALQGIRLAEPTLGERFVVTGLGLIGLLTVQLLRSHGCHVLGIDFDPAKLRLAESFGAHTVDLGGGADPLLAAQAFSHRRGVDGVIVTASTKSSEPIHQAAQMCRKRGRLVLVGVTGLELDRSDFYEKELSFQVSCSYGAGRHDASYEARGNDYPFAFVRWTAGRNFEAFLELVAEGRVNVKALISHQFPIADAASAYDALAGDTSVLGISLQHRSEEAVPDRMLLSSQVIVSSARRSPSRGNVAVIGAGGYTQQVLLPALARTGARLDTIVSQGGATAALAASKFGFSRASTDVDAVFSDDAIDSIVIATRHDTHANLTLRALQAGKHVYVEKPLAIRREDVDAIRAEYHRLEEIGTQPVLMVGFNRRFAPLAQDMKRLLDGVEQPKALLATVNAGAIPNSHWIQDPAVGGGRIIGEACHFIDFLRFLVGGSITELTTSAADFSTRDTVSIQMHFDEGSIGTLLYVATGHRRFPKERVEVFVAGRILTLQNFRSLDGVGWPTFRQKRLRAQDKGHAQAMQRFVEVVKSGGDNPVPVHELFESSARSIEAAHGAISASNELLPPQGRP